MSSHNVNWVNARARLHAVYHAARSYLEQSSPPEEGIKLAHFKPRKLKVAEPQSKTKKDNNKESGKNREEPPPAGNEEQGKVPSVISTHRSEVPTDVAALTRFLERKEVVFQKRMNDVNEARDRPTKMAHVRILQCWINQASKYEYAVKALDEAVTLFNPYSAKLPKTEEEEHQKRVKDWL